MTFEDLNCHQQVLYSVLWLAVMKASVNQKGMLFKKLNKYRLLRRRLLQGLFNVG
jgi:hypothetical protein